MSVHASIPFVATFVANVLWQAFLLFAHPIPRGWADTYADAAAGWVLPSIVNLVVLYRKGVLARWHRVGRAAAVALLSAIAAHIALAVTFILSVIGYIALYGIPKPN